MSSIHISTEYCVLYLFTNNFMSWLTDREIPGKLSRGRAPIKAIILVKASGIASSYS